MSTSSPPNTTTPPTPPTLPLTIHRTTHPITIYFTSLITFGNNNTPPSDFKWEIQSINQLITTALTKLYGFVGSVSLRYDIISINRTEQTITLGVEDYSSNALHAALTYYTNHNGTNINITTISQSSTLDSCVMGVKLNKSSDLWFNDILSAE